MKKLVQIIRNYRRKLKVKSQIVDGCHTPAFYR